MFDPTAAFSTSSDSARPHLAYLSQGDKNFVVKSFVQRKVAEPKEQIERELAAIETFTSLHVDVLQPVAGPFESLELLIDSATKEFKWALVYPYRQVQTLQENLRQNFDLNLIEEAGRRIKQRHEGSRDLSAIHSDGAPHNIFVDWVWFDLGNEHRATDLSSAKAHEAWRFLAGSMAVNNVPEVDTDIVAAFDRGYQDRSILKLALSAFGHRFAAVRLLSKPGKYRRWQRGDGQQLVRLRASKSLATYLA